MRNWLDLAAERRALRLVRRWLPHLPASGPLLDIGAGTGHNALVLQHLSGLQVYQTDVVDMHVVGTGPILFNGRELPFADRTFTAALLAFVLHYPEDPVLLLREARRVTAGPLLVMQSTYRGRIGLAALRIREFLLGRFAFYIACRVRFIQPVQCSLRPQRFFNRAEFYELVRQCGLEVIRLEPERWYGLALSYDLYVLE